MQGKELPEQAPMTKVYIGIDVSKATLDVHMLPGDVSLQVANDRHGIEDLLRRIAGQPVAVVVLEATGKWHRGIHRRLHEAGFPVAVVNPYRSRRFADAIGQLAKTDTIDARLLALFASRLSPRPTPPAPETLAALRDLVAARRSDKREATALANRLGATDNPFITRQLRGRLRMLERHIKDLDREIRDTVTRDPDLQRRFVLLTSIPGIGVVAATTLLAELAEIGVCSREQVAALAGVAPMNWDSGLLRGRRIIKGGRTCVRAALYMAAVAAIRCNPDLKAFYRRLRDNGKKPKLALTAVMRKLVIIANTLIAQNRAWMPLPP
jgi:transposase